MTATLITSWDALMRLAHELGQARLSQDPTRIEVAEMEHAAYVELCRQADAMYLGHGVW